MIKPGRPLNFAGPRKRDIGRAFGPAPAPQSRQRYNQLGMHKPQLLVQPPAVVLHLSSSRLLVDAPLAAQLEFEVLDGIGDVYAAPVEAGLSSALSEAAAQVRRRVALPVLLITGLLAHQSGGRADGPSPRTARVAPGTRGSVDAIWASSSSSDFGGGSSAAPPSEVRSARGLKRNPM